MNVPAIFPLPPTVHHAGGVLALILLFAGCSAVTSRNLVGGPLRGKTLDCEAANRLG